MKQLLYIGMFLIMCSCANDELYTANGVDGEMITLQFKIDIPEATPVSSRAINENLISNLYLLVFDENGRFISRNQATLNGSSYTVTLPQSKEKRIIHFIANYNWSGFDDNLAVTKDEGELIPPLQSTGLIFWQRVVLPSGINATTFASQQISLIRNMAKFSLVNQAASNLTNAKFALFNIASAGSVAPFNTVNRAFESVITEPAGVTFTSSTAFDIADIYTFERKNSTVTTNPTFVIVQGTYGGSTYYYKIDIVDDSKNVYDTQRNIWYSIVIQSVTMAGYTTLEEAKNSPASNNITASVLLQSYPTISDGTYTLSVDKTTVTFTSNGQTLQANATYKTIGGISQNTAISISLIQDANFPVVNGAVSYDSATGNITANINNVPANGAIYTATINIVAGSLSRSIRLVLRSPFIFTNVSITPSVVNAAQGSATTLTFTIPPDAVDLIPFNCYITSGYLSPSFGNIEVIHENGLYKYKWKVTAVGVQTINFTTNTTNAAEMILIDANLFQRAQVAYTNSAGQYRFSNVTLNPNPVNFGIGNSVQLKFTVPTAGTYKIYTSNLTPTGGTISGGAYTYTTASAGEQTINFTTNKQNASEIIKLTGTNYVDYTVGLHNQLVNISGKLTYSSSGSVINAGTVNVSVGSNVVGILTTSATGTYQMYIEANIGDTLTFSYTRSGRTYTATQVITSATMTINLKLI